MTNEQNRRKVFEGKICRIFIHCTVLAVAFLFAAQSASSASKPAPAASETVQKWKTYNYPADGFLAAFPVEPELEKKDVPTAAGSYELRSYTAQSGPTELFIGVCDYGSQAVGKTPENLLEGAKNGALANSNSHLLYEKQIALGNNPGIEFEAEGALAHFTARIYIVNTTLYQILVAASPSRPYTDTARFLNSFQFVVRTKP